MIIISNYYRTPECAGKDSGIYCIENVVNNKKYIGQTYSIKSRINQHYYELRNNSHHNSHLQSAWNKYGEDNFTYYVLEYCNLDLLNEKEKYWIEYYDSFNNGYNLTTGDIGCRGYKHSLEELEKMRKYHNSKSVLQLSHDLQIIAEWPSASQASKQLGLYKLAIISCCERINHVKSVGGFIWIYKDEFNTIDFTYYLNKSAISPKKVGQFDSHLNLIKIWESQYCIFRNSDFLPSEISAVCNHKKNSYKGYIWAFVNDNGEFLDDYDYSNVKIKQTRSVGKFDLQNNLIGTYKSVRQASLQNGVDKHGISKCCNGETEIYKGFYWKYI